MSTARQPLKSPQSISGTSTTPPWLTIGSESWSWIIDSHPFHSMSISPLIPQIRLFQTLTLKLQGQGHGCGLRARPYSRPSISLICFLFVPHRSDNNSWNTAILKFDLEKSKVKVMGEVKGQARIVHPVSNRCTSFSFHINRTNHSWDMSNRVFDLEKTHPKISKKIWQKKKGFHQNLNRQWAWPKEYSYQVLEWLVEWFSLYPADKQISVYQCHSCEHKLILILAWISNYIHYKVWDENYLSIPKLQCCSC